MHAGAEVALAVSLLGLEEVAGTGTSFLVSLLLLEGVGVEVEAVFALGICEVLVGEVVAVPQISLDLVTEVLAALVWAVSFCVHA